MASGQLPEERIGMKKFLTSEELAERLRMSIESMLGTRNP